MRNNLFSRIHRTFSIFFLIASFHTICKGQDARFTSLQEFSSSKYSLSIENGDSIYRLLPEEWLLDQSSKSQSSQLMSKANNSTISLRSASAYSSETMDLSHIPDSYPVDNTKDIGEIIINQSGGNGSVGYNVPISSYQTPSGMNPSILLAYNSMSGNGIAGYGWQIGGLSTISVANQNIYFDSKTGPANANKFGSYNLDGQRLIKLGDGTYQTEQGNIKVSPNVYDTNIKFFQVYYPNGTIATYGFTSNTASKVSYPITNITDIKGNTIDFTYTLLNNVYYIDEINYGGRVGNNSIANFAKITFSYESRDDITPVYVAGFKLQQDKRLKEVKTYVNGNLLLTYQLGFKNSSSSLLSQIDCYSNSKSLNPLKFYYGENNQIINFSKDNVILGSYFENALAPDLILTKGKFELNCINDGLISYPNSSTYGVKVIKKNWLGTITGYQYGSTYSPTQSLLIYSNLPAYFSNPSTLQAENGFQSLNAMDVDGDGKDELVKINSSSVSSSTETLTFNVFDVVNSATSGTYTTSRYSFNVNYGGVVNWDDLLSPSFKNFLVGDFLGNGKQTVLTITYNKNVKNENVQSWATLIDFDNKSKSTLYNKSCFSLNISDQLFVMDFDGDGKSDICRKTSTTTEIYTFDLVSGSLVKIAQYGSIDLSNRKMLLGDVNGDGKTDIVFSPEQGYWTPVTQENCGVCDDCIWGGGAGCANPTIIAPIYIPGGNLWSVYYSTGTSAGFDLHTMTSTSFESDDKLLLQDMNGDGLPDLVVNNNGILKLFSNINGTFNSTSESQTTNVTGGKNAFLIPGSVETGYRMSQLFSIYDYNLDAITFDRNMHTEQLLTGAITSTGIVNKHHYSSIVNDYYIYDLGTTCNYPYRNLVGNVYLNGTNNTYLSGALIYSNSTKYTKGVLDIRGKGFLGFEKVETYDNIRNTTTTQIFDPQNSGVMTSMDGPATSASYLFDVLIQANKLTKITLTSKTETNKLTNVSINYSYSYDNFGNTTSEIVDYGSGLKTTTTNLYNNYTGTPYIIGELYDQVVENKRDVQTSTVRKEFSDFDPIAHLPRKIITKNNGHQVLETSYIYENGLLKTEGKKEYSATKNLETSYIYHPNGLIKRITDPLGPYKEYFYNTFGQVETVTDHKNNSTTFLYDNWGRLMITTTPDGVTESATLQWVGAGCTTPVSPSGGNNPGSISGQLYRDLQFSAPMTQNGVNIATNSIKLLTNFTYNASNSGSLKFKIDQDANISAPPSTIIGSTTGGVGDYMYLITKRISGQPATQQYIDALGRELRSGTMRFDGSYLYSDKTYDSFGRLEKVSLPFKGNSATLWNTYHYDAFDRLENLYYATGKTDSYSYSNLSVTATKDGVARTTTKDALGKVINVVDPAGTIVYNLRADGQPFTIVAPGNVTTSFTYDKYGRQETLVDPSSGTHSYLYDNRGNLYCDSTTTDKVTKYYYDDYHRVTDREIVGEMTTSYKYNSDGQVDLITSSNGTGKTMAYDSQMRLISKREVAPDSKYFQEDYSYHTGTMNAISYSSQNGYITTENYSYSNGTLTEIKLNQVKSIWKLTSENEMGLTKTATTGNLLREYGYDDFGLPISRTAKFGSVYIQNFGYNFDPITGNLNWRKDNTRNFQEDFGYDTQNRLKTFGNITVGYDDKGNITDHTGIGNFKYENDAKPYTLTSITPYGTSIPLRNQDVTYNGLQRPATISENGYMATLCYNDAGDRVKMLLTNNSTAQLTRYYLGGRYEFDVETGTERLYLGGDSYSSPVVYVKETGTWNIYNICRDYLGSITHIVNANGSLKQELSYDPWGRLRNPNTQIVYTTGSEPTLFLARGFTGHEHLTVFGLINMNARLYDPTLGRFLSPDAFVQSVYLSQNYNRYSYCLNNPLRYIDPSGYNWLSSGWATGLYLLASTVATILCPPLGFTMFGGYLGGLAANNFQWNFCKWDWKDPETYLGVAFGAFAGGCVGNLLFNASSSFVLKFGIEIPNAAKLWASFVPKGGGIVLQSIGWLTVAGGCGIMTYEYIKTLTGKRPDDDRKITYLEAKSYYQLGNGETQTVDINSLDFSNVSISDFKNNIAQVNFESINGFTNINDGMVYGNLTLMLNRKGTGFTVKSDRFNFDPRWENKSEFYRNVGTVLGDVVAGTYMFGIIPIYAGGHPFQIKFDGVYYFK